MATDFKAFLTTCGLYGLVCLTLVIFFGLFRRSTVAYKFYNPARFGKVRNDRRPKPLPTSLFGWIRAMWQYGQADIATVAGYDAAAFIRVCAFGGELFLAISLWCCIVVLPCNISGNQVDYLIGKNAVPTSEFTYWVPPSPPPLPPGEEPPPSSGPPGQFTAPKFYEDNIPPAPPGLKWWKYKEGVPPLPQPQDYFRNTSKFDYYYWMYDSGYHSIDYTFSNLDSTSLTNIGSGDQRLWVHLISTWVVSLYLWKLLRRYNSDMVALRTQFLTRSERSVESRTILVRDIPGVYYGTVPDRVERTALRFLPGIIKRSLVKFGSSALQYADKGVNLTVGNFSHVVLPDAGVMTPPDRGPPTPARRMDTDVPTAPGAEEIGPGEAAPGSLVFELNAVESAQRSREDGASTSEFVEEQFNDVFDDQVEKVHVCLDARRLDRLVNSFNDTLMQLEDLLDDYISYDKRRRKIKRKRITVVGIQFGDWGLRKYGSAPTRIDALTFYADRLQALVEEIEDARAQCLPPNEKVMPAAFVIFKQRRSQVNAVSGMFHHDRSSWFTDPAPGPEEIVWKNLGWQNWERSIRFVFVWACFFLIVAFYIPVVSFIQALLQIDKVKELPGIKDISEIPMVDSLLSSFLPSLVLRIFLAILPYILKFMGQMEGLISQSTIQFSVVRKYFAFQFLTVFLTSLVAGTILSQLQQVLHNPSSLVTSIAAAAPQTATFFMLYLLLMGLIIKPFQFLRIPGLVLLHIKTFFAGSERAKARLWEDQYVDYGWEVPDACTTILLGLVNCLIQPMIAPVALLYFLVNSALYKYQLIYVHKPRFETGGLVWSQVFDQVMFSAIVFQIIMFGLMFLKGNLLQAFLLLPLPFLFAALWSASNEMFRRPLKMLSQRAATNMDRFCAKNQSTSEDNGDAYQHPAFKFDEARLESVLEEAQRVDEILNTPHYRLGSLAASVEKQEEDIESGKGRKREQDAANGSSELDEPLLGTSRPSEE